MLLFNFFLKKNKRDKSFWSQNENAAGRRRGVWGDLIETMVDNGLCVNQIVNVMKSKTFEDFCDLQSRGFQMLNKSKQFVNDCLASVCVDYVGAVAQHMQLQSTPFSLLIDAAARRNGRHIIGVVICTFNDTKVIACKHSDDWKGKFRF